MFSQEVADEICTRLAEGRSLASICRDPEMPTLATVFRWLADDRYAAFRDNYTRAVSMRADAKFEELDDVSEEAANSESAVKINGLRLKADNIKWQLARMNSKKYGDKIEQAHTGSIAVESIRRTVIDPATGTVVPK